MRIQVHESIDDIPAAGWNRLAGGNPFVKHQFLAALEHSGSANAATGWQPQHLTCTNESGELIGALPLYLKSHSWGEYVFDWVWAEAYQRAGRHYYPKLVAAVPFTPVSGPRLLLAAAEKRIDASQALIQRALELANEHQASSVHCLFPNEGELQSWKKTGFLPRMDCQFHWHNRGYRSFDDYITSLSAEKRKKIKRERRRVCEADICHRVYTGRELDESLLEALHACYSATYAKRGQDAYLKRAFFTEIAAALPDVLLVNFAFLHENPVACAICFRNTDTLYGRHWGCQQEFHSLHFETCYYQWIDYCIREEIPHFNPGTQGEHKLARGFEPTPTWSAHYLCDALFRQAIDDFLRQETRMMQDYIRGAREHLPFHKTKLDQPLPGKSWTHRY